MNRFAVLIYTFALAVAAVITGNAMAQQPERGGTISVGEDSWQIVPAIQCRVFPGGIVSIAGHAGSDPDLEIVIDVDPHGPTGVRVGGEGGGVSWHSVKGSFDIEVQGKRVRGAGTFSQYYGGAGETRQGEFTVDC